MLSRSFTPTPDGGKRQQPVAATAAGGALTASVVEAADGVDAAVDAADSAVAGLAAADSDAGRNGRLPTLRRINIGGGGDDGPIPPRGGQSYRRGR